MRDLVGVLAPVFVVEKAHVARRTVFFVERKTIAQGFGFCKLIALGQAVDNGVKLFRCKRSVVKRLELHFQIRQQAFAVFDEHRRIAQAVQLLDQVAF